MPGTPGGLGTPVDPHGVVAGPDLVATAQAAVTRSLDNCKATDDVILPDVCPFDADDLGLFQPHDLVWTIDAYPVVGLAYTENDEPAATRWSVPVTTPGHLTVSGKVTNYAGEERPFSVDCTLGGTLYRTSVGVEGVLNLVPLDRSEADCA